MCFTEIRERIQQISFYVVVSSDGKFFHRKGYGGYGKTWTDDVTLARVYTKIGPARAVVTYFAIHYPTYPVPQIVILKVGDIFILNEVDRVEKAKEQKIKKVANRELSRKKQ